MIIVQNQGSLKSCSLKKHVSCLKLFSPSRAFLLATFDGTFMGVVQMRLRFIVLSQAVLNVLAYLGGRAAVSGSFPAAGLVGPSGSPLV